MSISIPDDIRFVARAELPVERHWVIPHDPASFRPLPKHGDTPSARDHTIRCGDALARALATSRKRNRKRFLVYDGSSPYLPNQETCDWLDTSLL